MWKRLILIWSLVRGDAKVAWHAFRHPHAPGWFRAGVIGLGLYLFSPVDLVPDILPLLGLADDLVLVPLALHWLLSRLPAEVLQEARRRAAGHPASDTRHPGRPPLVKRVD